MDALVGHTGFVGSTLRSQHGFDALFNSSNIDEIADGPFDGVVCAAAPGSMFEANRFPDRDLEKVEGLIERLDRVATKRFVLVSSIAVLEDFAAGLDETTTRFQNELAYGRHRRRLETFCADRFDDCLILRLPALFGSGLRKNFMFDLLNPMPSMLTEGRYAGILGVDEAIAGYYRHDPESGMYHLDRASYDRGKRRPDMDAAVKAAGLSAIQFHAPDSTHQFYDTSRLWSDIELATQHGLPLVHLATEPVRVGAIYERLAKEAMPATGAKVHHEDMRTVHADLWNKSGPYLMDGDEVMMRLAAFHTAATVAR
ncbi:NAD(P)-dependent oxidoreductase [Citreimonas salinaria]|uniref:Nucleoside-diphosphate-sugar epimerase n=1 Tax=Citreimonas salinaria TaxID=321339 RepID=A0A1H3EYW3_9RHOB|nr:NAD(P)-dependent oxidoreductase [Citreimonas salinaria]SDX83775.1 Nucleoside-diphosphate-sugar epimerase [Citreimonas salinaria]